MNEKQALKVAAECIGEQIKALAERANRYHMEPKKWADLEKDYRAYQRLVGALQIVERLARQGNMF